jgi:hypothetical protein
MDLMDTAIILVHTGEVATGGIVTGIITGKNPSSGLL